MARMKIRIEDEHPTVPADKVPRGGIFSLNNTIYMKTNKAVLERDPSLGDFPYIMYVNAVNLNTGDLDYMEPDAQVYLMCGELRAYHQHYDENALKKE